MKIKGNRPVLFVLAALALALAGCAGPIDTIYVHLPAARDMTHFIAGVDGIAKQAGLRGLPGHRDTSPGFLDIVDYDYLTPAGKPSEFDVLRKDDDLEVIVHFPPDGSLEPLALKINDFATSTYGSQNVDAWRPIPFVEAMLGDF